MISATSVVQPRLQQIVVMMGTVGIAAVNVALPDQHRPTAACVPFACGLGLFPAARQSPAT